MPFQREFSATKHTQKMILERDQNHETTFHPLLCLQIFVRDGISALPIFDFQIGSEHFSNQSGLLERNAEKLFHFTFSLFPVESLST